MECSFCYYLHYIERIRPVKGKSSLLFGGAIDAALNDLLINRDLDRALKIFYERWDEFEINGVKHKAPAIDFVKYAKSDVDEELLEYYGHRPDQLVSPAWVCLRHKGSLFLHQYYRDVLPKIKEVIAVQEPVSLSNDEGDEISGFLDLIVVWEDGKTYLLDNKSSSVKYEENSAKLGQQLPLYYYMIKEKYKLDGIGYIVLSKKINKNRKKICSVCQFDGSETRHKTCNNYVMSYVANGTDGALIRCGGDWIETIHPSVDIQYVLNQVDEADENRVIEKFDEINYNITNGFFAMEHTEKRGKYGFCPYKDYYPGNPDFIKLERKTNEEAKSS